MTDIPSNDPVVSATPPVVTNAAPTSGVLGTKMPSTISFSIGVLLFLMPFVELKCNTMKLQEISGVQLATGFKIKAAGSDDSFVGKLESLNNEKTASSGTQRQDPNTFALAALVLGVLGLLVSLANAKGLAWGGVLIGIAAAVSLIILFIDIKQKLKGELSGDGGGLNDMGGMGGDAVISLDFTGWFYLVVLCFIGAAYFSYKRVKAKSI